MSLRSRKTVVSEAEKSFKSISRMRTASLQVGGAKYNVATDDSSKKESLDDEKEEGRF